MTPDPERRRLRVLYLTNGFPFPLTSGYLRHYFLIRELAQRHDVTLLSIVAADHLPEHANALAPYTERVLTFESAKRSRSRPRRAAHRFAAFVPGRGGDPAVRALARTAGELARREPFDVVLLSGKRTYPVLASLPGLPVVADICDATSLRLRRSLPFTAPARLPLLLLDLAQVRRVERRLVEQARHLLFASCRDRDELLGEADAGAAGASTTIVPNGVDVEFWSRTARELGRKQMIFTGAMHYGPNEDAALHLIETIMPLVRRSVPDAELAVVGRDPTRKLVQAGAAPGVTVTGFVDDVRPHLESAAVFAAPLRFGAGIQNKLLEAMAMEVPTVASSLAAEGLRTDAGERPPVATADDPAVFAERVVERLRAARLHPEPDSAARRYVEERFVWKRSGELLEQALLAAASTPGQATAAGPSPIAPPVAGLAAPKARHDGEES